jgi:LysM repeat protein
VKAGDTLYAIARRYNTTVDALVKVNNLPAADSILSIGQKLSLPS